jgi:DNA-binding NarL/FixJ family response regulator
MGRRTAEGGIVMIALSKKEREVLVMKANGLTNRQIAREKNVRSDAVSAMLTKVYKRLGADNGIHAVATALKLGIITFDEVATHVIEHQDAA